MAIALHHSRAKGAAKLVLLGIANHDGDGGAWPSVATLQIYAGGADRRSVQRAIDRLESLGEVTRVIQRGGTESTHEFSDWHRPNLYHFKLTCPPDCDRSRNHRTKRTYTPEMVPLGTDVAKTPPGVESAKTPPGGRSQRRPNHSYNQPPRLNKETHVNAREENEDEDASGDSFQDGADAPETDAFGGSHRDAFSIAERTHSAALSMLGRRSMADAIADEAERCPRFPSAPHAFGKAGTCIDCGAIDLDHATVNLESGEVLI